MKKNDFKKILFFCDPTLWISTAQFWRATHVGWFTKLVPDIIDFRRLVYHNHYISGTFVFNSAGVDFHEFRPLF